MSEPKGKVVVIGSGLIGRCWAVMFAKSGYCITMYDMNDELVRESIRLLRETTLPAMEKIGTLNGLTATIVASRIQAAQGDLAIVLRGASHVQECVPEAMHIKQAVFESIGVALKQFPDDVSPHLLICSSSSNLTMSRIASKMAAAYRPSCIVCHPVNPPTAIPLVELVPSPETSSAAIRLAKARMIDIGQCPVVLNKECDGFILNRLQYALLAESIRLVQEGIASPEDVDLAVSHGLSRRWAFMGPFQTIDLNAPLGVADYFQRYGESIRGVISQQDNAVAWAPSTLETINTSMRQINGPVGSLPSRCQWRDDRLVKLNKHLTEERKHDQGQL